MTDDETTTPSSTFARFAPWLLGLLATTLALIGSWRASPTDDEPTFLGHGNYVLSQGDFRAPILLWQPPLALYVQAAGLTFVDLNDAAYGRARSVDSMTELGDALIFASASTPETVLRAARIPIALATGLLAALAALLARQLAGTTAMLIAGTLVAISPVVYGHGGLATTDAVAALCALAAAGAMVRLVRAPTCRRGLKLEIIVGAVLGLALLAKHSSIALAPVALGATLAVARRCGFSWRESFRRAALVVVATAIVTWAGYGFHVGPLVEAGSSGDLSDKLVGRVPLPREWVDWIARELPVPAPRWWQSLLFQASKQHGRLYFRYFDDVAKAGWWTYFPVVTLGKLTLGCVGLCALSLVTLRKRRPSADEWILFLAFAVPFAAAVVSRHNLGIRHVLPALAPLFVLVGVRIARTASVAPRSVMIVAAGLLLVVHAAEGLCAARNPIAWWNLAFGGTREGWRVAAGSNADWGQGLWALRDDVRREGLEHVHLVAASPQSVLDRLGEPRIEPMRGAWWTQRPTQGWLAVSTSAQWIGNRVPFTDAPPDRFVAGCYRLYRLPLKPR